jgi:nucleoside-diphosphate-sugar epimerase
MTDRIVVVFGGTGFLGRRVVQHLLDHGFAVRVATRHVPEHAPRLHFVRADIHDRHAIETASGRSSVISKTGPLRSSLTNVVTDLPARLRHRSGVRCC